MLPPKIVLRKVNEGNVQFKVGSRVLLLSKLYSITKVVNAKRLKVVNTYPVKLNLHEDKFFVSTTHNNLVKPKSCIPRGKSFGAHSDFKCFIGESAGA